MWEYEIIEYKNYLKLERSLSDNSISAYINDVKKLTAYLELEGKSDINCSNLDFKILNQSDTNCSLLIPSCRLDVYREIEIHESSDEEQILYLKADLSDAKEYLDWAPKINLDEGIYNTVKWIKENYKVFYE